ncbi:mCpol domain-containing protein [Pseudofrankia sp. BMG5.37]|uniref:mCpol domain-containing protein n=1 Tax=Pseudofrankia sp. BMG5.37 TaxID=3050035 RepID=UPI0028957182|nr:mCpol domain-containing protein [Pseudofrankia sp. BMG5.37]MDT3440475.1 mCpol domain-containing protein [Pseudofrankia sp. BMG5.37]
MDSFGNCLLAATEALRRDLSDPRARFERVHVLNTSESLAALAAHFEIDASKLDRVGLRRGDLNYVTISLDDDPEHRLDRLLGDVADIMRSTQTREVYFDLTGGPTQIKIALGIFAFLLGAPHVYTLEVAFSAPAQRGWDLDRLRAAAIDDENIKVRHRRISGLDKFDGFGHSSLTIVERVRAELEQLRAHLESSLPSRVQEISRLVSLLEGAELARIDPRQTQDESVATQILLMNATAAADAFVDLVINSVPGRKTSGQTLGPKLNQIRDMAGANSPHPIDSVTLLHLSELLLRLRNRAVHWSDSSMSADVLRLQGELGARISKSFIWLVTQSLGAFLHSDTNEVAEISSIDDFSSDDEGWFVGIDGDGTGAYIAGSMRDTEDCVDELKDRSRQVGAAIDFVRAAVKKKYGKDSVVFCSGDNILFRVKGRVIRSDILDLLSKYHDMTQLTASAGVGRTPYQASIGLRLAKAEGGGAVKMVSLSNRRVGSAAAAVPPPRTR